MSIFTYEIIQFSKQSDNEYDPLYYKKITSDINTVMRAISSVDRRVAVLEVNTWRNSTFVDCLRLE